MRRTWLEIRSRAETTSSSLTTLHTSLVLRYVSFIIVNAGDVRSRGLHRRDTRSWVDMDLLGWRGAKLLRWYAAGSGPVAPHECSLGTR